MISKVLIIVVTLFVTLVTAPISATAQEIARYGGPIIDMHMHAKTAPLRPDGSPFPRPCIPNPCEGAAGQAKTAEEVLRLTLEAMERNNIVLGFLSGYDATADSVMPNYDRVQTWVEAAPGRFLAGAFLSQPGHPSVSDLRRHYAAGTLKGLGEIATQYYGYPPSRTCWPATRICGCSSKTVAFPSRRNGSP